MHAAEAQQTHLFTTDTNAPAQRSSRTKAGTRTTSWRKVRDAMVKHKGVADGHSSSTSLYVAQESVPIKHIVAHYILSRQQRKSYAATKGAVDLKEKLFGLLRFLEAPLLPPARFVRFSSELVFHDNGDKTLFALMCGGLNQLDADRRKESYSWKLKPPCAIVSLAGSTCRADEKIDFRMDEGMKQMLRRGLAEAVEETQAWIITDGNRRTMSTQLAGQAVMYAHNEQSTSELPVCLGVLAYSRMSQDAACEAEFADARRNGRMDYYAPKLPPDPEEPRTIVCDPYHTHFLMVEHGDEMRSRRLSTDPRSRHSKSEAAVGDGDGYSVEEETAQRVRAAYERYLALNDVSGDGIQTPKVVLVVAGGCMTFKQVRDALDPNDASTGTSVPVLVVVDSGYAAQDIAYFCATGQFMWQAEEADLGPDRPGDWRPLRYKQEAMQWLPEILALGKQTGMNTTRQLSFCTLAAKSGEDAGGGGGLPPTQLSLAIQQALLNDCPNAVEEVLLTIQWGSNEILETKMHDERALLEVLREKPIDKLTPSSGLEPDELATLTHVRESFNTRRRSHDAPDAVKSFKLTHPKLYKLVTNHVVQPSVMQLGLASGNLKVVRILYEAFESPLTVRLDELFEERHNRYKAEDLQQFWKPRRELIEQLIERVTKPADATRAKGSASYEVLKRMVSGYEANLEARVLLDGWTWSAAVDDIGPPSTHAMWQDIMMWAVLSGNHEIAELTWPVSIAHRTEDCAAWRHALPSTRVRRALSWPVVRSAVEQRTRRPMLAALQASQLCLRLSEEENLRPDRKHLLERAQRYEGLATETLSAVRESAIAYALLCQIPWEMVSRQSEHGSEYEKQMQLLWQSSVLEEAAGADGQLSFPCRNFVAHRHSQETLERYFISTSAGLLPILIQCLMPFLPGTVVEVYDGFLEHESVLSGPDFNRRFAEDAEQSVGVDEQQALQEVKEALEQREAEEGGDRAAGNKRSLKNFFDNEVFDLQHDITSFRFLFFYNIPKVKFATDFAFYLVYVAQNVYLTVNLRQIDPNCVTSLNVSCSNADEGYIRLRPVGQSEVIFWCWCLTKFIGEIDNVKSLSKAPIAHRTDLPHWLHKEGLSEYISDTWNQQDLLFSLIAGLICALRLWYSAPGAERAPAPDVTGAPMHTLAALPVDLYAILVVMNFYRVLRYLSYYRSVGVLTLVVNFMLVDVGVFATLLFLITVGFGFAFVVLLPTDEADDTPWRIMGSHPVWSTWWGLFEDYDRLGMYRAVGEQMPTAIVAPSMLWIYQFFSVVLLMNLLVALMSDTYARVTAEGELRWQYARAQLIREYLTQSPLPAPLNVLVYLCYNLPHFVWRNYRYRVHHERILEPGFKYVPSQRVLTSLRRAEQDAVRKYVASREEEERGQTDSLVGTVSGQVNKLARDTQEKFENMNLRIDQLFRRLDTASRNPDAAEAEKRNDLGWSATLDRAWYTPPAFTTADVGKLVRFTPVTWELMNYLSEEAGEVGGVEGARLSWATGRAALTEVAVTRADGTGEDKRLVMWQGMWSLDAKRRGRFAKIEAAPAPAPVPAEARSAPHPKEYYEIVSVANDKVMSKVGLAAPEERPLAAPDDHAADDGSSDATRRAITATLDNPELYPHTDALLNLMPTLVDEA